MSVRLIVTTALVGGSLLWAAGAYAAPVYIGISVNGGAITTVASNTTGNGTASVINDFVDGISLSASVQGSPTLPEPTLYSSTLDLTGSLAAGHTYSIYMSELNQFPLTFANFQGNSTGGFNYTGGGAVPPGFNSISSFTISTYVTECAPPNAACAASDAFATGQLLFTDTYTQGGATSKQDSAPNPLTTAPYVVTEVYTFTTGSGYGEIQGSELEAVQVPEPASMALLGMGAVGLGVMRRRRSSSDASIG